MLVTEEITNGKTDGPAIRHRYASKQNRRRQHNVPNDTKNIRLSHGNWVKRPDSPYGPPFGWAKTANAYYVFYVRFRLTKLRTVRRTGIGVSNAKCVQRARNLLTTMGHRAITFDWQMMNVDDYFFCFVFFSLWPRLASPVSTVVVVDEIDVRT